MSRKPQRRNRASRRHPNRPNGGVPVATPTGWPSPDIVADTIDANVLARELLDAMKPATMQTILKRMDPNARKAVLAQRNIPSAKVSQRAAAQVLGLVRAVDKPAEGTLLAAILDPASDLFQYAVITPPGLTGMRLLLADLGLPLIADNESLFQGLRTWSQWAQEDFEDLTLAVVIGMRCQNSALAASYLAANHPDIAKQYESLRKRFPRMPRVSESRLTVSNPLTRYFSARTDQALPSTSGQLNTLLAQDSKIREREIAETRSQQRYDLSEYASRLHQRIHDSAEAEPEETAPPETPDAVFDRWSGHLDHELPALPTFDEWAQAVAAARECMTRLLSGRPPEESRFELLLSIRHRLDNFSLLLTHVTQSEVFPVRDDLERALTMALSDPRMSERLGNPPETVGDVIARLEALPDEARNRAVAVPPPADDSTAQAYDLSDLDSILSGETGKQLLAFATMREADGSDRLSASAEPDGETA